MSKFFEMRQVKYQSLENQSYTTSYNRVSWDIPTDDMSTDLSQSYLLANLQLAESGNPDNIYSDSQVESWIAQNVAVSFGKDEDSYSPACLVKTCRLVGKGTGQVIEEQQFSNVLSQLLFQLTNNKETLSSVSLLSGTSLEYGQQSGITEAYSSFLKSKTSVRILLKDIFGCCNTTNFFLSVTGGLLLQIELEDRCDVLRTAPLAKPARINFPGYQGPPILLYDTALGAASYTPTPEVLGTLAGSDSVFLDNNSQGLILEAGIINHPKAGYRFQQEYFVPITWTAGNINTLTIADSSVAVSVPQLGSLGFFTDAFIKLNFEVYETQSALVTATTSPEVRPKILEFMTKITAVVAGTVGGGATITFQDPVSYDSAWITAANYLPPVLSSVETFTAALDVVHVELDQAEITLLTTSNSAVFSDTKVQELASMGLCYLSGGAYYPTNAKLELAIENIMATQNVIAPDVVSNQNTPYELTYSNVLQRLPTNGGAVSITSITAVPNSNPATWTIQFSDTGLRQNVGLANEGFLITSPSPDLITTTAVPESWNLYFLNVLTPGTLPNAITSPLTLPLNPYAAGANALVPIVVTYNINRFDLVLIQQTKSQKMPMSMVYSAYRMEPAMIENSLYMWQRQFILEPNTYNVALITPNYTNGKRLLSERRSVSHYRWSVNNVNTTNRDVVLQNFSTDYPSSLYTDQLMSYFSNSQYQLRSLHGLPTLAHSQQPVLFEPLVVYHGISGSAMVGNPAGATIQIELYGDETMSRTIDTGAVFLFKSQLRQWA